MGDEEERKACPILSIGTGGEALVECVGNECMFWIEEEENCVFVLLARKK